MNNNFMKFILQLKFFRHEAEIGRSSIYKLANELPVKPAHIWEKGETKKIRGTILCEKESNDGFLYESEYEGSYLQDEIEDFLEPFQNLSEEVKGCSAEFGVIIYTQGDPNPCFHITQKALMMLASLGCEIDVDAYVSEGESFDEDDEE